MILDLNCLFGFCPAKLCPVSGGGGSLTVPGYHNNIYIYFMICLYKNIHCIIVFLIILRVLPTKNEYKSF